MGLRPTQANTVRFGTFEADLRAGELYSGGRRVKLQERPFQLLTALLKTPGEVLTRDELRQILLPPSTFVDFDASIATTVRKLREALGDCADNPQFIETVGRRGYRFIGKIDSSETEVKEADSTPPPEKFRKQTVRRPVVWAALVALALAVFAAWIAKSIHAGGDAGRHARRSVAVLGFKNLTGQADFAWLSTALSEMLTTELEAGGTLRLVQGDDVARVRMELNLSEADTLSNSSRARLRENLNTDMVVFGDYTVVGSAGNQRIRLDLRVQDVASNETIAAFAETGSQSDLFELVSSAGSELRSKLGAAEPSSSDEAKARASVPYNPDAARYYAQGLDDLRLFDARAAVNLLQKAVSSEPGNAAARSALADAWSALGYDVVAQREAKQALDLSSGLSREEQLSIEGRYRELTADWPKATEIYRTLFSFFPDEVDYGLSLARVQTKSGRGQDAIATTQSMRKRPSPLSRDVRIDIAEASASGSVSDFKWQQALAESAASKARSYGAKLLLAEALTVDAQAFEGLGQYDKSISSAREAQAIYFDSGDRRGAAVTQILLGDVMLEQGNFEGGREQFQQAAAVFDSIGSRRNMSEALDRIGNGYYLLGRLGEAKVNYEKALDVAQEIDSLQEEATDLNHVANVLDGLGELGKARETYQQAIAKFQSAGNKRGVVEATGNLGLLFLESGDLEAARKTLAESISSAREIQYRRGEYQQLSGLGDILFEQGKVSEAKSQYELFLSDSKDLRDSDSVAQAQTSLATVALEQGRFAEGITLASQAADKYKDDQSADFEASTYALLSRLLLGQGRVKEAQSTSSRSTALAGTTESRSPKYEAILATSYVEARTGRATNAVQHLKAMIRLAHQQGYKGFEYEARLALGQIELKSSASALGRKQLNALDQEAAKAGFTRIAEHARDLAETR